MESIGVGRNLNLVSHTFHFIVKDISPSLSNQRQAEVDTNVLDYNKRPMKKKRLDIDP